jgi:hypothetical protein
MDDASNGQEAERKGWRRFLRPRNIILLPVWVLAVLFIVFLIVWIITSLSSQLTGVNQGSSMDALYMPSMGGVSDRAYSESVRTAPMSDDAASAPSAFGAYEARQYSAVIRTRHKDDVCDAVERWRVYPYVTFEHMTRSDSTCHYRFKVERDRAQEILEAIVTLDPTRVTESAELMRERVLQHESERDILMKRDEQLERMLAEVTRLYDQLMNMSASAGDTSMLTKAIDDRLRYMRSLTDERVRLARELDALDRRASELLDRIEQVSFTVQVEERRFVNGTQLKDSWMDRVKQFIRDANGIAQDLTIGLLMTLLVFLKYAVQIVVIVVLGFLIAVPLWRAGRRFLRNE